MISVTQLRNGATFEENAIKKSRSIYELIGQPVIADDSGLEIDFLNGEPGVNSARFCGYETPYKVKNEKKVIQSGKDND